MTNRNNYRLILLPGIGSRLLGVNVSAGGHMY
jgi:hypothetical protein